MPYASRLLRAEVIAEGTMAFDFERPAGFVYQAGQNARLTLMDTREFDSFGPARTFSFVSAPHEPSLTFATRIRDTAFKRILKSAAPGLPVKLDEPGGVMTLHGDGTRPAVFIAGGIGVTPFVSMLRHASHARLPHRLWLFYSNRRPEDAPFLTELGGLERANPACRFVLTMTKMEKSGRAWDGETGPISRALLERHLRADGAGSKAIYYLAGPPGMVMHAQDVLQDLGVSEDDMRDEEFYGY